MKKILITGAGTGIGRAAAFALAARGYSVIATTETEVQAVHLTTECARLALPIDVWKLDITLPADREKIRGNNIDVLINNAAIGESGSLADVPLERIRNSFEVNVVSPVALTQIVLEEMIPQGRGRVLFISSLAGRAPMTFLNPYSMTKFALSGGVAALRKEMHLISPHIHISVVEPGPYATGFNEAMLARKYQWMTPTSPFYRFISHLQESEKRWLRKLQVPTTSSIVKKIIRAVEANEPALRYVAPAYQGWGIQIARIFGR